MTPVKTVDAAVFVISALDALWGTEHEIAERAGVSIATASYWLHRYLMINPSAARRIGGEFRYEELGRGRLRLQFRRIR